MEMAHSFLPPGPIARSSSEITYWILQDGHPRNLTKTELIRKFPSVASDDLPAEDRTCPCCRESYIPSQGCDYTDTMDIPVRTRCGHTVGSACLKLWLPNNTCPMCRRQLFEVDEEVWERTRVVFIDDFIDDEEEFNHWMANRSRTSLIGQDWINYALDRERTRNREGFRRGNHFVIDENGYLRERARQIAEEHGEEQDQADRVAERTEQQNHEHKFPRQFEDGPIRRLTVDNAVTIRDTSQPSQATDQDREWLVSENRRIGAFREAVLYQQLLDEGTLLPRSTNLRPELQGLLEWRQDRALFAESGAVEASPIQE